MTGILFWIGVFGIFYVYAGYPLLLTALARIFPRRSKKMGIEPGVTLLISAYNEEDVIAQKLENSLALDYPIENLQILVAADGSDDRTVEIVESFASHDVELSFSPLRRGKMAAINHAMQSVRNEIVLFSDANNMYDSVLLRKLVGSFNDPKVGAVSGSKVVMSGDSALGDTEGLYWKYESFIKSQEAKLESCTAVAGEVYAIRRNLYVRPPDTIINDDFYVALQILRQGYNIDYVPSARSFEKVSQTEQDEIMRRTRIVAGRYQALSLSFGLLPFHRPLLLWQIVSHKYLRPMVPFGMILVFIANLTAVLFVSQQGPRPLLYLHSPFGIIFLVLQVIFYLLAWLGKRWHPGGFLGKLLYIPTFLVNSNLAALYGLINYVTGKQTVVWKRASRRSSAS